MRIGVALWLLLTLVVAHPLYADPIAPPDGLGMWVWSKSSFATEEARQRLVRFCVKHGISQLDVQIRFSHDSQHPHLQAEDAFRDLILLAGRHGITTAALRGNPRMFSIQNHERSLHELNAIIAFSRSLPENSSFRGIKYDVEPYLTKEWKAKGKPLNTLMHDYLAFLRKAKTALHEKAPHLWLAVDTPFWWDKDEFALEFEGERKRFNEHVQDLTDFIVIMSYRCSAKKVLSIVEDEKRYAGRIGKVILLSLETIQLQHDPEISFWSLPRENLLDTVHELLKKAKEDPAIGGVMIHCYRSLLEKLDNDASEQSGEDETAPLPDRPSPNQWTHPILGLHS
jgi:hypothetical protein